MNKNIVFVLLCLCTGVALFNVAAMPNVVNHIMDEYDVEYQVASRIISYYLFSYGISALLVVFLHSLISRFGTLVLSMSALLIINLLIVTVKQFEFILFLRILNGIASSMVVPTSFILIKEYYKEAYTKRVGYYLAINSCIGIVGTLISSLPWWRLVFLIPGIMSFATVILLIIVFHRKRFGQNTGSLQRVPLFDLFINYFKIFLKRNERNIFILIFINGFICTGIYTYLGYYFKSQKGISESMIGLILPFSVIGSIIMNIFIGKAHRMDWRNKISIGFFILPITFTLIAVNNIWLIFFIIIFFYGLGRTIIHNTLVSSFLGFKEEIRSNASSLNSFTVFISGALGVRVLQTCFKYTGFLLSIIILSVLIVVINSFFIIRRTFIFGSRKV